MAPDARLLVGRVCGTEFCADSAVLAGMEWAAAQRAKVVNLSLGNDGSDGTDPLVDGREQPHRVVRHAVRRGGRQRRGPRGRSARPPRPTPRVAVGSVGSTDTISSFSSRGPRIGDHAVKPDITAPGEKIMAARGRHRWGRAVLRRRRGTSMASPHVAGAAAILAQQHPEWTAAQLKAALMSTAKPGAGLTVNEQGAGRVDVARAVTQPVHAEPGSLSFGFLRWPRVGLPPATRTVTYRNAGDADASR